VLLPYQQFTAGFWKWSKYSFVFLDAVGLVSSEALRKTITKLIVSIDLGENEIMGNRIRTFQLTLKNNHV